MEGLEREEVASDKRALISPMVLKLGPGWRKQVPGSMPLEEILSSLLCLMLLL